MIKEMNISAIESKGSMLVQKTGAASDGACGSSGCCNKN